jgi:hypothetical protein
LQRRLRKNGITTRGSASGIRTKVQRIVVHILSGVLLKEFQLSQRIPDQQKTVRPALVSLKISKVVLGYLMHVVGIKKSSCDHS